MEEQKRIKNYFYFKFVSLEAEEFLKLAKEILSGSQKGKDQVKKMIDDIVKQLKQEDYEDVSGETPTPIDDTPPTTDVEELDMDTILDKINKRVWIL